MVCAYNSQYELRLTASDNLKENYTVVVIHVKDVNDNPPVFERPTYRTQITEEDDRNLPKRVLAVSYWPAGLIERTGQRLALKANIGNLRAYARAAKPLVFVVMYVGVCSRSLQPTATRTDRRTSFTS